MFSLLPAQRQEWIKLLVFPFQVYPFIAISIYSMAAFMSRPYRRRFGLDSFDDFAVRIAFSCAAYFVLLLCLDFIQLLTRHHQRGHLNFGIAVFSAVVAAICMPNYVRA
jgi:hypothetical protein